MAKRTRTWDDERTYLGDSIAIFIGHAIENIPAQDGKSATTQDGYNTVVWTRENNQWVLGHWQWSRAGLDAERDREDGRNGPADGRAGAAIRWLENSARRCRRGQRGPGRATQDKARALRGAEAIVSIDVA